MTQGPMKPGNSAEDNTLTTESPTTAGQRRRSHGGPYTGTQLETAETAKGPPTATASLLAEGELGRSVSADGRGKPWTRDESDSVGEPHQ